MGKYAEKILRKLQRKYGENTEKIEILHRKYEYYTENYP
jgi:hypothetical protein